MQSENVNFVQALKAARKHTFPSLPQKEFILKTLAPRIAIVSSRDVDQACQVSGLPKLIDLLLPFGENIDGKIFCRDINGLPSSQPQFFLRFCELSRLGEVDKSIAGLVHEFVNMGSKNVKDGEDLEITKPQDIDDVYLSTDTEELTPWFKEFKNLYLSSPSAAAAVATEHESFNHPTAFFLAISASVEDPVYEVGRLIDAARPSHIYDKGFMDPNALKFYLLVHDSQQHNLNNSNAALEKLRRTFGVNCAMIKINSNSSNGPNGTKNMVVDDIWKPFMLRKLLAKSYPGRREFNDTRYMGTGGVGGTERPNSFSDVSNTTDFFASNSSAVPTSASNNDLEENGGGDGEEDWPINYGAFMSDDDVKGIKSMVKDFIVQSLIPYMEKQVQYWNEQVAANRRGVAGRLFTASRRLFGQTTGTQAPATNYRIIEVNGVELLIYAHTSPEAQLRRLADFSFQLGDFRTAQGIYDGLRKDFSADKAWKYYAGALEMVGICYLLGAGSKYDCLTNLEQVIDVYLNKCKCPSAAVKSVLLHYELFKVRNMYKEASRALEKIADEINDLRAALLFEQAGHCYLRTDKPRVRKYSFCMVLSGYRYGKCDQREHSFRCYVAASKVYDDKSWSVIDSHIKFALGRQCFFLGQYKVAMDHFMGLLRESEQSATLQGLYLREFLYIYQQYVQTKGDNPKEVVEEEEELSIPPVVNNDSLNITSTSTASNETEGGVEGEEEAAWTVLSSIKNVEDKHALCAVGEHCMVSLEIYNPMQVSLSLSNVMLDCTQDGQRPNRITTNPSSNSTTMISFDEFELENLWEVVLMPLERKTLKLKLIPKIEGTVQILALKYTLNNVVPGYRKLWKRGKRLNSTKQERMNTMYSPDTNLALTVTAPMPLLKYQVNALPTSLLSGEVVQAKLELTNAGERGLTKLQVKVSNTAMIRIGSDLAFNNVKSTEDSLAYRSGEHAALEELTLDNSLEEEGWENIDLTLSAGATTTLPLWLRGERIGKHSLRLALAYQSEDPSSGARKRVCRCTVELQVLPSLRINTFTRPSACGLDEFVLGIEMENLQAQAEFELTQISLTSPRWKILPIDLKQNSVLMETRLASRATMFSYFYLTRIQDELTMEELPESFTVRVLKSGRPPIQRPNIKLILSHLTNENKVIKYDKEPLHNFYKSARKQWRHASVLAQYGGLFEHQPYAFTLYNTNDVDLTLFWRLDLGGSKRMGNHHVVGINLGTLLEGASSLSQDSFSSTGVTLSANTGMRRKYASSLPQGISTGGLAIRDENPAKVVLRSAGNACNDFNQGLCWITIAVTVKNVSTLNIKYLLELVDPEDLEALDYKEGKPLPLASVSGFRFDWCGPVRMEGQLEPGHCETLWTRACFAQPGVFNLNRWRLSVFRPIPPPSLKFKHPKSNLPGLEDEDVLDPGLLGIQTPNLPHLITVVHVNGARPLVTAITEQQVL